MQIHHDCFVRVVFKEVFDLGEVEPPNEVFLIFHLVFTKHALSAD